jgi:hypothetical protein
VYRLLNLPSSETSSQAGKMPILDISDEFADPAGGFACFHHCVCSFRPSLIAYPALLPRLEQVKRIMIQNDIARATRLTMLNVMMMASATLDTWMGSEDVPRLNVLGRVAMTVGLRGCLYVQVQVRCCVHWVIYDDIGKC